MFNWSELHPEKKYKIGTLDSPIPSKSIFKDIQILFAYDIIIRILAMALRLQLHMYLLAYFQNLQFHLVIQILETLVDAICFSNDNSGRNS